MAKKNITIGIGNFHKSLPHNEYGEVIDADFAAFENIATTGGNFENVPSGQVTNDHHAPFDPKAVCPTKPDKLVSPQAGRSTDRLGPNPADMEMPPPPGILSGSTAAEMVELFWMALLRDVSFDLLQDPRNVSGPINDLTDWFGRAIADTQDPGQLKLIQDLPVRDGKLDLTEKTLFRSGLKDEELGPLVSQFFLHDAAYGTQVILQKQFPYRSGLNFLTDHGSWLLAQNAGYDKFADPYPFANDPSDRPEYLERINNNDPRSKPVFRRIATMRDLARFVHKDALHQAYFNAALLLLGWGAEVDDGNPTKDYGRQRGFATMGPPHLLTLVSEVASRALKVVWRQKWLVHRRLRPEAYGGLMQMQKDGYCGVTRNYGLPADIFTTRATQAVRNNPHGAGTWFLPMAFSSGSPIHPAYGAGHATVAGACVTILKAWFKEDQKIAEILAKKPRHPITGEVVRIVQPGLAVTDVPDGSGGFELPEYKGSDANQLTVGGELNKIASNVAMGRSMGGVHWRSDNTRSLRLGEQIAAFILADVTYDLKEKPSFSFTSFNGNDILIKGKKVFRSGSEVDPVKTEL